MIVLDAPAVVEFLLGTARGDAVAERIADPRQTLHAPHLLDVEVTQALKRFVARGEVSDARASQAFLDLADLDVTRHPHDILLPRVWQLRAKLNAYDATYVALAEALPAVLVTTTRRLAAGAGRIIAVEMLSAESD